MYNYRPVKQQDIDIICKFPEDENELFFMYPKAKYPLSKEQLEKSIKERSDSTVLLKDNNIVAFANFITVKPNQYCKIGNVIVAPKWRGKGISEHLIKTMIDIAKDKYNVKKIKLSCFSKNTKGLLLYTKLGFKPKSIEKRVDKDGNIGGLINMEISLV